MSYFQMMKDRVDHGRRGDSILVPFPSAKMNQFMYLGPDLYHLVGGAGGSGKSSFVDHNYVLGPYEWYKQIGRDLGVNLKIIVRSLERSSTLRLLRWVCYCMYKNHGVITDVAELSSWNGSRSRLSEEKYQLFCQYSDYFNEMTDVVELIGGPENPTGLYKHARNYALQNGTLYYWEKVDNIWRKMKESSAGRYAIVKEEGPDISPYQHKYIQNDPHAITIWLVDYIQASTSEQGFNDKQKLDKLSEYARHLRDIYHFTPVMVSQLNRDISDTFRRVKTTLQPEDKDFAGSSSMYNDCDFGMILFNPHKYGLTQYMDYLIPSMTSPTGENRFRSLSLLKNTYGPDNIALGFLYVGENGYFGTLPKGLEMTQENYNSIKQII